MKKLLIASLVMGLSPWCVHASEDLSKIIDIAQRRVIRLYGGSSGLESGYGTGVLVSVSGRAVTADSILLRSKQVFAVTHTGTRHEVETVTRLQAQGLALIQLKRVDRPVECFDLTESHDAQTGDWVVTITNAFNVASGNEPLSVGFGPLGGVSPMRLTDDRDVHNHTTDVLILNTVTSNPGCAGGAVINLAGRLVGVIGQRMIDNQTGARINFAIQTQAMRLAMATTDDSPSRPSTRRALTAEALGIQLFKFAGNDAPAYVDAVTNDSAAERAGLKADDLILRIGPISINRVSDLQPAVGRLRESTTLTVKRKNDVLTLNLGLSPESGSR